NLVCFNDTPVLAGYFSEQEFSWQARITILQALPDSIDITTISGHNYPVCCVLLISLSKGETPMKKLTHPMLIVLLVLSSALGAFLALQLAPQPANAAANMSPTVRHTVLPVTCISAASF